MLQQDERVCRCSSRSALDESLLQREAFSVGYATELEEVEDHVRAEIRLAVGRIPANRLAMNRSEMNLTDCDLTCFT